MGTIWYLVDHEAHTAYELGKGLGRLASEVVRKHVESGTTESLTTALLGAVTDADSLDYECLTVSECHRLAEEVMSLFARRHLNVESDASSDWFKAWPDGSGPPWAGPEDEVVTVVGEWSYDNPEE